MLPLVVHVEGDGTDYHHDDEDDRRCNGSLAPGLGPDDGVLADVAVLPGEVLLAPALRLDAEASVLALAHQRLRFRLLVGGVAGGFASSLELDVVGTLAAVAGGDDEAEMCALSLLTRVGDARVVPVRVEHLDGRRVLEVGSHSLGHSPTKLVHLHHLSAMTSGAFTRPEHVRLKYVDGKWPVQVSSSSHDMSSLSIFSHGFNGVKF